jgi:hypothetical protein
VIGRLSFELPCDVGANHQTSDADVATKEVVLDRDQPNVRSLQGVNKRGKNPGSIGAGQDPDRLVFLAAGPERNGYRLAPWL